MLFFCCVFFFTYIHLFYNKLVKYDMFFFYLSKWIFEGYNKHKDTQVIFNFTELWCQIHINPTTLHPQKYKDFLMVIFLITDLNLNKYNKINILTKSNKRWSNIYLSQFELFYTQILLRKQKSACSKKISF